MSKMNSCGQTCIECWLFHLVIGEGAKEAQSENDLNWRVFWESSSMSDSVHG